jgi:hypothetical protein
MTVQPKYHWPFTEGQGATETDTVSGVKATLAGTTFGGHGRIGNAIKINGKAAGLPGLSLGNEPGRFHPHDFTVAFGMKVLDTFGQTNFNVIGNRGMMGHGNGFSIRLENDRRLTFEVDGDAKGKDYAVVTANRALTLGKWHHVAAVREGLSLKLYLDGELAGECLSKTGIAFINPTTLLRLGASPVRKTPVVEYEDLRLYHQKALNATEVSELVPPVNRPLRAGHRARRQR